MMYVTTHWLKMHFFYFTCYLFMRWNIYLKPQTIICYLFLDHCQRLGYRKHSENLSWSASGAKDVMIQLTMAKWIDEKKYMNNGKCNRRECGHYKNAFQTGKVVGCSLRTNCPGKYNPVHLICVYCYNWTYSLHDCLYCLMMIHKSEYSLFLEMSDQF